MGNGESWIKSDEQTNPILDLEQQTKHEEPEGVFLISRLQNPIIRKQIIDLLEANERAQGEFYDAVVFDENGRIIKDSDGEIVTEKKEYVPLSRQQLEEQYDKDITEITTSTPISLTDEQPHPGSINLNWIYPHTGSKLNDKQKAVAVAHEKGHVVRNYNGEFFSTFFNEGFDRSAVDYTMNDYWHDIPKKDRSEKGYLEARKEFYQYLFSAQELAERMSQLKDYFGMKGNDQFTKAHLEYAREHYIQDTGMDNRMTFFFKAITPEKENRFLELMNYAGI